MGGGTAHAIRQDANDTTGTLSSQSRRFVEGRFYLSGREVAQVRKEMWKVREQSLGPGMTVFVRKSFCRSGLRLQFGHRFSNSRARFLPQPLKLGHVRAAKNLFRAEACSFPQSFLGLWDRTNFAAQAQFTNRNGIRRDGFSQMCSGNRESQGQIRRWFSGAKPPTRGGKDVLVGQLQTTVLFQDRNHHRKSVGIDARRFPLC